MHSREPYTRKFIIALFLIAPNWEQPKCPLTQIVVYFNTMENYAAMNELQLCATQMTQKYCMK